MADLLKTKRSSQIFSVCGLLDVTLRETKAIDGMDAYQVELLGLDVFDPVSLSKQASTNKSPSRLLTIVTTSYS
jgi:adenine-specific DNA-methyltransferase